MQLSTLLERGREWHLDQKAAAIPRQTPGRMGHLRLGERLDKCLVNPSSGSLQENVPSLF